MAHNLNSMFYYGSKPWHGLGKKVDHVLTAAEAIDAAGLNWSVEKRPIFLEGQTTPIKDNFAIVRTDTGDALGIVGNRYTEFQNKSAFSFADAIVGLKEAMYHTAGALGKGERVWLLLKLPGCVRVVGDDVTDKYLLLTNTHDGTSSVKVMFTPIRVVCQNTLNVAMSQGTNKYSLAHFASIGDKVAEVQKALGIVSQRFTVFEEAAQALTKVQFKYTDIKKLVYDTQLVPEPADDEKLSTRAQNIIDEVSRLFDIGKGAELPGVRGTAWGAFNAIVEYVDHGRGSDLSKRADSLLFGSGAQIKQKAWDLLTTRR